MSTQMRECQACGMESDTCKICSACGVAAYCNRACQMAVRPNHAPVCKKVKKFRELVRVELAQLVAECGPNYLEENVGHIWGLLDGRRYCRAVHNLALRLVELGQAEGNTKAFEAAEELYLELMRLIHSDNPGIRYLYPFVLLPLGRIQDCYNFISWWATIDPHGEYDWGKAPERKKGEWGFGRNCDISADLFEDSRIGDARSVQCHHLVALLIIKLLIVKSLEGAKGKFYPEVNLEETDVEEQLALAKHYRNLVKVVNPTVLAALEKEDVAEALLARPKPMYTSPGSVEDALVVMSTANYFWNLADLRSMMPRIS